MNNGLISALYRVLQEESAELHRFVPLVIQTKIVISTKVPVEEIKKL